jgi:hypothetical protein
MVSFNPSNRVSEYAQEYATGGKELIEEYPMATVAVAFGLGLAAGIALVGLLTESEDTHRQMSHRLGAQIMDAMSNVIPDSVSRAFGSR